MPVENASSNVKKFVIQNQDALRQGNNTFAGEINGVQKSIKVYIENTTVKSINLYPGVSNRVTINPTIDFGKVHWK